MTISGRTHSPAIVRADTDQIAAYIVRFAPERIEAEIRAKQAIINSYEGQVEAAARNEGPLAMAAAGLLPMVELAVRMAASAYDWHPEYDHSWAK